ncbi:sulfite reductase (NADPH) flavoprotein alpha-component [Dyadobacter soli]|uniref:NADPH--hemoprotein reductase n=1 Tax=Dyadobacter soli TaxID=659014 RepID=A0A1G7SG84_9BACT|nr:PepSY domain-containing protein [Dyadobacter soli]SDG21998.1 sulfite reductase (NADPH) flavoprotein alpha-component [Dyadobacter soli]
MTLSIWRYAHLALAFVSTLFLVILSVTGVILAFDAVNEKMPSYRIEQIDDITLAACIPALQKVYPEIIELSVDHNQFVTIDATDADGGHVKAYIDPRNGKVLGPVVPKSEFIQWNIALHRSLFLKETGRIAVGVVSFLLFLITISGAVLILKRQQGVRHFFAKINRDFFSQYFHVVSGRLFLIPILVISLTGTYLFMVRIGVMNASEEEPVVSEQPADAAPLDKSKFPVFQKTRLADVEKVEFPLLEDDPEEYYVLKMRDKVLTVSQITGAVVEQAAFGKAIVWEKLSLDLHTGRTSVVWAIVLGFASLNILAFIYTGFVMTWKRTRTKIRNKFKAGNAEIVILVGTENGSTLFFANQIHQQLLADGKRSFLAEMNQYQPYPQAEHLLIFTSTYGLGSPPANATHFNSLVEKIKQQQQVAFSVIGFGSKAYSDFCAFANEVDQLLEKQPWATRYLGLHTVNDKSPEEFVKWVHAWSEHSLTALATAPAVYTTKQTGLRSLKVVEKTLVSADNATFKITLAPESRNGFQSGDLLAIYPASDSRERFYSIGRNDGMIQLMVKLYENGLGSGYLYQLEPNSKVKARIMPNPAFHFPQKAPAVVMIANGTGIAPFLGMVMDNRAGVPVSMYAGFRHDNELTAQYRQFAALQTEQNRLEMLHFAFSRGKEPQYVMDLITRDAAYFTALLATGGVIMICGSLRMQHDVEALLNTLCVSENGQCLDFYKARNQVLTDCY